jgi:hypothetical protein
MSLDAAAQMAILLFGCTAIWLVGRPKSEPRQRWGYILGICAQPFWVYTSIKHRQWGILAVTPLYAYSWAQGVWFHWIKPRGLAKDYLHLIKDRAAERSLHERELWSEIVGEYFQNHPVAEQEALAERKD